MPRDLQDLDQTTFHIDYDITDPVAFKYIFGATEMNTQAHTDFAGAEFNFFMNYDVNRLELDSHEFQLTGGGDRISWLAGVYTWDQSNSNRGLEWSHADWTHAAPAGPQQILDFDDVMAHTVSDDGAAARPELQRRRSRRAADGSVGRNGRRPVRRRQRLGRDPRQLGATVRSSPSARAFRFVRARDQFLDLQQHGRLNGSDRSSLAEQDGFAYFGELRFQLTDNWDITVGYRQHDQDNQNWNRISSPARRRAQPSSGRSRSARGS